MMDHQHTILKVYRWFPDSLTNLGESSRDYSLDNEDDNGFNLYTQSGRYS